METPIYMHVHDRYILAGVVYLSNLIIVSLRSDLGPLCASGKLPHLLNIYSSVIFVSKTDFKRIKAIFDSCQINKIPVLFTHCHRVHWVNYVATKIRLYYNL